MPVHSPSSSSPSISAPERSRGISSSTPRFWFHVWHSRRGATVVMIERLEELLAVESVADGAVGRRSARPEVAVTGGIRGRPTPSSLLRSIRRGAFRSWQLRDEAWPWSSRPAVLSQRRPRPLSAHSSFLRAGSMAEAVHITIEASYDSGRFARRRIAFGQQERSFFACDVGFHKPDARTAAGSTSRPQCPTLRASPPPRARSRCRSWKFEHWPGRTSTAGRDVTFPLSARFRRECRTRLLERRRVVVCRRLLPGAIHAGHERTVPGHALHPHVGALDVVPPVGRSVALDAGPL